MCDMPLSVQEQLMIEVWSARNNIPFSNEVLEKIELYCDLIRSWSKRMNLISQGDLAHIIECHFLDSLVPIEIIPQAGRLLDVGSGAGFPAIPLALLRPAVNFTLVESIHKKALFLKTAIKRLNLSNVQVMEMRLEEMEPAPIYDIITVRALPHWEKMKKKIMGFLNPQGRIIYFEKRGIFRQIAK
jgi:16S rRNA (guanine527-N7)-methyltransferase